MAEDRDGVEELIPWVDASYVRYCPMHRLAFDADPVQYKDAGRCCPKGGERLIGIFARWRDDQGVPMDPGLPEDDWL